MERLPAVVTSDGAVALPLGGQTARRLAAALVAPDGVGQFAEALAQDASLALWTIVQARRRGESDLRGLDAVARWLASNLLAVWPPAPAAAEADERFAELAARSFSLATLAAAVAKTRQGDPQLAYLLGLLQLAPAWWYSAGGNGAALGALLPEWLRPALDSAVDGASNRPTSVEAACVRAAVQASDARDAASLFDDAAFDTAAHAARVAAVRHDWLVPAEPGMLDHLIGRLRRLHALETEFQQALEYEKLTALKELAYGAGHEINNPLANISARAQSLLPDEHDPARRRMLASINTQAFRAHEMIADMMLFARPPAVRPAAFDLAALLAELRNELAPQAAEQHTQLALAVPPGPRQVVADKTQIAVALRCLCVNALEALVAGGLVELKLAPAGQAHDDLVRITVADDGPGIPPEIRPRIFDPYFSGREAGRGLGLGLSKCWRIVTEHGGRVDVDCPQGRGARFTVTLPANHVG